MTAAADPTPQPTPDVEPAPEAETSPVESTPETEDEAVAGAESTPAPDSEAEPVPALEGEAGFEAETPLEAEPAGDADGPSDADAAPGLGADPALEAEPAPDAELDAEPTPDIELDAEPTPDIELDAEPTPDAEPAPEAAGGLETEADADAAPESDAAPEPDAAPAPDAAQSRAGESWGRVDEDGTVSVREGDTWRVVGQFPDGSPEEALAYFERKYADLASEVSLLEVRHRRGGASASDLRAASKTVSAKLAGAAAVGDLASLEARVAALTKTLAAASETEAAAAREAVDEAITARTQLVERAEALAARDPKSVQWKQASTELTTLFDEWQSQQQNGPRLPKTTSQQLWKRFRDARATVDKHRREFYAELDEAHKSVRDRKAALVEKAEALAPKGEDGIVAYRALLDQWKTAGRAGKKVDDALWARFKAAGDALYGARIERESAETEESREKIVAKRELLVEAKTVADESDIAKARTLLTGIQRRWDEIGRIFPREAERGLDDDLRKVEQALRTREETDWKRNDPAQKARANDMTRQLSDAIQKLEDEVAAAQKKGDKSAIAKATEALEARKSWLRALGG